MCSIYKKKGDRKMANYTEKLKKLSSALAANMVDRDSDEWPPFCSMFAYQPEHPSLQTQENEVRAEEN